MSSERFTESKATRLKLNELAAVVSGRLYSEARRIRESGEARPARLAELLTDLADRVDDDASAAARSLPEEF